MQTKVDGKRHSISNIMVSFVQRHWIALERAWKVSIQRVLDWKSMLSYKEILAITHSLHFFLPLCSTPSLPSPSLLFPLSSLPTLSPSALSFLCQSLPYVSPLFLSRSHSFLPLPLSPTLLSFTCSPSLSFY